MTSATGRAPPDRVRASPAPTLGVEEEFLLLRPDGEVACVAPQVLRTLAHDPFVQPEFMRFQVESSTSVCTDLESLEADLLRERRALSEAAAAQGARLVATGTPPFAVPGVAALTDNPRFRTLTEQFAGIADDEASCACHVHVAVPSRDVAAAALGRIRGWLPVLLALAGNSPLWRGRDTGWESYRYVIQTEWPTAVPPPVCADARAYDALLGDAVAAGYALDLPSVYYFARLSPRYPTVEVRIADSSLTVAESLLVAALCRALVTTAVTDVVAGRPYVVLGDRVIAASASSAARSGLDAPLVDPTTGRAAVGHELLATLLAVLSPALEASGDLDRVQALLDRRLAAGSGAARQRVWRETHRRGDFVDALATATVSGV